MEKKVNTILNCLYYAFYTLIAVTACGMYRLMKEGGVEVLPPMSNAGQIVQYAVIFYVIISVAGSLYVCKRLIEKAKVALKAENDATLLLRRYRNYAIIRICLIGIGAVAGIIAFYIMGGYTSMLWCAAIAVIGLYFCKPTLRKMELELLQDEIADNN